MQIIKNPSKKELFKVIDSKDLKESYISIGSLKCSYDIYTDKSSFQLAALGSFFAKKAIV